MARIETPDLDAQLAAARAQLKAADAQVHVRKAQADFARSTYNRWRDSPKGVVSEQEREEKHATITRAEAAAEVRRRRCHVGSGASRSICCAVPI